jgi:hypothetical protein
MTDSDAKQARAEALNRALDEMDALDRAQDDNDDAEVADKAERAISKRRATP